MVKTYKNILRCHGHMIVILNLLKMYFLKISPVVNKREENSHLSIVNSFRWQISFKLHHVYVLKFPLLTNFTKCLFLFSSLLRQCCPIPSLTISYSTLFPRERERGLIFNPLFWSRSIYIVEVAATDAATHSVHLLITFLSTCRRSER